ncbi:MAG: hypothetical protein COC04_01050 [Gammaproteobacteria bacterium]|nr:MAG: hypothetical protein COC04_01050 [Gammaproteobacteria bacterium]
MSLIGKVTLLVLGLVISVQAVSSNPLLREEKFFRNISVGEKSGFVKSQRIELSPGFSAPTHSHPVPTFGVINRGVIVYQEEGKREQVLKKGDTFFEPQNVKIIKFINNSNEVAAFTVFYIVEKRLSPTIHID